MWKYAALVNYVGTQYTGWQKQRGPASHGGPSIQEFLDQALRQVTSEPETKTVGSGRTDSGVHAAGQVCHFVLRRKEWKTETLKLGMNTNLPPDIRIVAVRPVAIEFHAQHEVERKQYSYYFQQGPCAIPYLEPYSWWIHRPLDVQAMQKALDYIQGEHDFLPFQGRKAKVGPTVRTLFEAQISEEKIHFPGQTPTTPEIKLIRARLVGNGFLKQMVRGIAGTLLQVGEGRRPPEDFARILKTLDRGLVGATAPARALWMERIWYDPKWDLNW